MEYFGLEIYDGMPLKQVNIDINVSLQEQWYLLTQDICCINYNVHDELMFSVDVGYYPSAIITATSHFKVVVIEGPYTDGGVFF
ncbi:MAG TPA: hypothetical protein VK174_17550 [Chitinophagales bacterium]|nr:hypothetical protein [Chitinophagales bacterium]